MPTENRSSNTEMVSVPRDKLQAWQERFSKAQMFQQSTEVQAALAKPAQQHQGEPVWFMTEGGLSVLHAKAKAMSDQQGLDTSSYSVPLFTHADPAEVALLRHDIASYLETMAKTCDLLGIDLEAAKNAEGKPSEVLFKHAQELRGEVERLRGWISAYKESRGRLHEWLREEQLKNISLRAQLAEAQALLSEWRRTWGAQYRSDSAILLKTDAALSASAEPSAPADLEKSRLIG